jgi:ABC-type multidrug transport system fused ATPase/permease subunit
LIPFESMHVWFRWIFYLNPGAYAFEALMANEFVGREFQCIEPDYIPYGAGYSSSESIHRGCSVPGSKNGMISGEAYIREQYSYSFHHIWRSFGIIVGFWIFFIGLTSLGFELKNSQGGSSVLLYKRGSEKQSQVGEKEMPAKNGQSGDMVALRGSVKHSTFTWNNLDYHVPFNGEKKQLLDKVFGFVKPGNLVALMGASGAGKTT